MNLKEQHTAHLERQARLLARAVVQREEDQRPSSPNTKAALAFVTKPKLLPPLPPRPPGFSRNAALETRIAQRAEAGFVLPRQSSPPTALLLGVVAHHCGVDVEEIKGKRRLAPIVRARQICFWLMREMTGRSYPEIARRMGGWNHTSVLHGYMKLHALYSTSPSTRRDLEEVREKVRHAQYDATKPMLTAPIVADMAGNLQEAA